MGRNWKRCVEVSLSASGGSNGTTLAQYMQDGDLKIQFEFESHTSQSPASCQIIVYNILPDKAAKIKQEFSQITLKVGYDGQLGELFKGSIIETAYGEKLDGFTSAILRMYAISNDIAYGNARLSETLPAGWTHQDVIDRSAKALAQYGVPMGQVLGVDASAIKHPRPAVLVGMVRDILRETALSLGATWTMNGGQLDVIGVNHPGTGSSGIVLSPETGGVDQPIQRLDGVNVSCLINPAIRVNTTVKIASKIISPTLFPNAIAAQNNFNISEYQHQLDAAGEYRVLHIKASGDTRGQDYTMHLTCIGVSGNLNQTQLGLNYQ